MVAVAGKVAAVPHLVELFDVSIARDRFGGKRRRFVLAALALRHPKSPALQALCEATSHTHDGTRAAAALCLERVLVKRGGPPHDKIVGRLLELAQKDNALLVRFAARRGLGALAQPVPHDVPQGSFVFKVWLAGSAQVWRRFEVGACQDLDSLHRAIMDGFDWDGDHPYLFHLGAKMRWTEHTPTGPCLDGEGAA